MLKKIEENKKLEYIFLFLVFLIPISLCSIFSILDIGNELWNFQIVYKIGNGYKLYNEVNATSTPLFYYIGMIFVKIFGNNILGFRILNIMLYEVLFFIIYRIFRTAKKSVKRSLIFTLIISVIFLPIISDGANLNILGVIFYLIGIILILNQDECKKYNIYQGINLFLIYYTSPKIFFVYLIGLVISTWLFYKKIGLKRLGKSFIIFFILLIISIITMSIKGNFSNFINYVFLGNLDLKSSIANASNDAKIGMIICLVLATCSDIFGIYYYYKIEKKYIKIAIMSLSLLLFSFPFANFYNVLISSIASLILVSLVFDNKLFLYSDEKKWNIVLAVILVIVIGIGGANIFKTKQADKIENPIYNGAYFYSNEAKEIEYIIDYLGKSKDEYIILSDKAAFYMLPLNRNNKDFDFIHYGCVGKNGIQKLIEELKNNKNKKILISEKYNNSEEIQEFKKFVKENYVSNGTLGEYRIFENN